MKTIHSLGTYLSVNRGIIDQKASQPYSSIHQPMISKILLCEKCWLLLTRWNLIIKYEIKDYLSTRTCRMTEWAECYKIFIFVDWFWSSDFRWIFLKGKKVNRNVTFLHTIKCGQDVALKWSLEISTNQLSSD